MFLAQDVLQEGDANFSDVVRHWHRDGLAFVHKELPQLLVIVFVAFVLMRVVSFFVNRLNRIADSKSASRQRASVSPRPLDTV